MVQLDKELPWKLPGTQIVVAAGGVPLLLPCLVEIEGVEPLYSVEGVSLKAWFRESTTRPAVVPILAQAGSDFLRLKDSASPPFPRSQYEASYLYESTDSPVRFPLLAEFSRLRVEQDGAAIEFLSDNGVQMLVEFSSRGYEDFMHHMKNMPAFLKAGRQ